MIRKATEINPSRKYRILLYGVPGVRKTSVAISAPRTLLIDTEGGYDRVDARFRRAAYIQPKTYDELLSDLTPENVKDFDTIAIDTGGALLEMMKSYVISQNAKNGQKDGTTLSIQGYGAIGREFARIIDRCYRVLDKNVVLVFHAKEDKDGDQLIYRIDVEGGTKNAIWKSMDLAGFMEVRGQRYFVSFSPTERVYAKSTRGISGEIEIPTINGNEKNDILSRLFDRLREAGRKDAELVAQYDAVIGNAREIVDGVTDKETASDAMKKLGELPEIFESKREAWEMLKTKASSLGLAYTKDGFVEAAV
jgi:hypothetical protein